LLTSEADDQGSPLVKCYVEFNEIAHAQMPSNPYPHTAKAKRIDLLTSETENKMRLRTIMVVSDVWRLGVGAYAA